MRLGFWFDHASTYSMLSALEIEARAAAHGVAVDWRPFLLGPIFRAQGWDTSPFAIYPAKGRYMVRDMERLCAAAGLPPFRMPAEFPARSLAAARCALALGDGPVPAFSRHLFRAQFFKGADIADPGLLSEALTEAGADAPGVLARAATPEVKDALRSRTTEAAARGLFGAPSFTLGDELFWGHDRLEMALRAAAGAG